ncbi:MAG: Holliday junction branch migration protein RuvA [Kiritimatiellae bacterium]|nr:Holliday junction branch migration protein RuvA [Kiritimatiellia bacterium]
MITFLEGILVDKKPTQIIINVNGVGYQVLIPLSSYDQLPAPNGSLRILTYHHVREDAQMLFGFSSEDQRSMFQIMLNISGIGPKLALGILSGISVRDLKTAVIDGDIKRLNAISGVGKKTAERMVIELRDKFSSGEALEAVAGIDDNITPDIRIRDSIMALTSLGYKQVDAQKMVQKISVKIPKAGTVEDIVRLALTAS